MDVSRLAALRQRAKSDFQSREGVKLSFLPFFAKAAVEALKTHPSLNASIDTDAGTVTYHEAEHLGVAVDTDRGLLVPVIREAGDLNIGGLARRIADLADRTRNNKIAPDDLSGGTFTLTNTGSRGALFDTPIINQPQVGILGTGAVVKRAVVVSDDTGADSIAIRSMVYLALTYDHRLVDGADAARFLVAVKSRLEDGAFEADLGLCRPPGRGATPPTGDDGLVKVVVTGSTGLIGSALVPHLRKSGHDVVRLVRRSPGSKDEARWDPVAGTVDAARLRRRRRCDPSRRRRHR